jgi:trehalose 6-phosphate phosphatase
MSDKQIPRIQTDWALFLDVDGTLLEIAETPQNVHVPEALNGLLIAVSTHLDGAVALVSGRSLQDLDTLFAPLRPAASGQHGCERRDASGNVTRCSVDVASLDGARREVAEFVGKHPGLLLEDKGYSLAVHFRRNPNLRATVLDFMSVACDRLGSKFSLQPGKCVLEIRPAARSKGTAIATFMTERPFYGRRPVFIGDDLTDEEGFSLVHALDGISIKVGNEGATVAQHRVGGVSHVLQWLDDGVKPVSARKGP